MKFQDIRYIFLTYDAKSRSFGAFELMSFPLQLICVPTAAKEINLNAQAAAGKGFQLSEDLIRRLFYYSIIL